MLINASRKLGTMKKQLLQKTVALQRDREALLLKSQSITYSLAQMLLMSSYKFYSAFGCWDPVKVLCLTLLSCSNEQNNANFELSQLCKTQLHYLDKDSCFAAIQRKGAGSLAAVAT